MFCEGDKIYPKPGSCPVCGMDLVAVATSISEEDTTYQKLRSKLGWSVLFTAPIFLIAMSEMFGIDKQAYLKEFYWNLIQLALSIPVVFFTTWMFMQRAWTSLRTRRLNMFTLIGFGAGIAWLYSVVATFYPILQPNLDKELFVYYEAATVILTLVLVGQVLEAKAHSKTSGAIKALLKLVPNVATLVVNGVDKSVAIEQIKVGDVIRIKPGGKIPVDGVVVEGSSTINESMISGEPIPVEKYLNDVVHAGTINESGSFLMKAQKVGSETLLSQIIKMVNDASRSKAPIQKMADKIAAYFVPIVLVISALTFLVWMLIGTEPVFLNAMVNAIAVLIIACPCVLGLVTPMSVMVGVGRGSQHGVLIKSAEALELMKKVSVLIVDKTGTLTQGKPTVEDFVVLSGNKESLLAMSKALNTQSEHPLAQAINSYAHPYAKQTHSVIEFTAISGKGVSGTVAEQKLLLGNEALLLDASISISTNVKEDVSRFQAQGKTVSFLVVDGLLSGYFVLSDAVKKETPAAILSLQKAGVEVHMLTGDNELSAKYTASLLGIAHYQAQCLPQDKLAYIETLQKEGKVVAMAGDGINDAPALAKSDVGIAMGTGTDVAIESAAITLVKGNLQGVLKAKNLSHAVVKNIKQNFVFAFVYNVIGIPIAAGVLYPVFGLLLSPMIAAAAMSFSSVSVISNSLRLRSISL